MSDVYDSILPIIVEDEAGVDQIGSSVLLSVSGSVFLLTAAHVTDGIRGKTCLIPTRNGLEPIAGWLSTLNISAGMSRDEDRLDIAYFRLDPEIVSRLPEDSVPLSRTDLRLTDIRRPMDAYTFAGFPYRKTKVRERSIESEMYSYTGLLGDERLYRSEGYDLQTNILVEYDREHSVDRYGKKLLPPLPHGISGGAIFAYPKDRSKWLSENKSLQLVGIAHTYNSTKNYMVGTSMGVYINCIGMNHPELLASEKTSDINISAIPLFVGIAYYKEDEFDRLREAMEDREIWFDRWDQWRTAAENGIEVLASKGTMLIPVEVGLEEFVEYCSRKAVSQDGRARTAFVNWKLARMVDETIVKDGT